MGKKFEDTVSYIGQDYKKERIKITLIVVFSVFLTIGIFILTNNILFTFLGALLGCIVSYFFIDSYSRKKSSLIEQRNNEFINIIGYFQTFIMNKFNIYQSFVNLKTYSSDWMKEQIDILLLKMDEDKSIKPFVDFSKNFTLPVSRNIAFSIYQMIDQGENSEQMIHFNYIFTQLSHENTLKKKDKIEKSFSLPLMLPVIGAGLLIVALTLSILTSLGDMINVI